MPNNTYTTTGFNRSVSSDRKPPSQPMAFRPLYPRRVKQGLRLLNSGRRLYKMPMRKATTFSMLLHVLTPAALVVFILFVLKIPVWEWLKPKASSQDLTFVLVQETQTPPPKKALFRGNANQRAGGKRNEKQPIKPADASPSGGSGKALAQKPAPPKKSPTPSPAPVRQVAPSTKPTATQTATAPAAITVPGKAESVPEPDMPLDPDLLSGGTPAGDTNGSAPASGGSGLGASTGTGSGEGSQGNPQGGGGAPGVDVIADADFGPFMSELEKRIKKHWIPPRGSDSRKVMLLFYLARDGKLVKIETRKSSGDEETDRAAIAAVVESTPFIPFPPQVKEDILPVEFTFDYNVLNPKNTKRGLRW